MNPSRAVTAAEASAPQVVGSLHFLDEFAAPVHQEQIFAEQDRVQRPSVEPLVHVPVPQIQDQIVETAQNSREIHQREKVLGIESHLSVHISLKVCFNRVDFASSCFSFFFSW